MAFSSSTSANSLSSPSSRSTFTSTSAVLQMPGRSIEEVWKDINLGTAIPPLDNSDHPSPRYGHHHHHATAGATCDGSIPSADLALREVVFQDFLGRSVKQTGPAPGVASLQREERARHGDMRLPESRSVAPAPRCSCPAIILSLNSGADFHYMDAASAEPLSPAGFTNYQNLSHGQHHGINSQLRPQASSLTSASFSDFASSTCPGIFPLCNNNKRGPELQQQQLESIKGDGGDRRNKRMIKNRESAARSRARKQAYTNELELEVNHLTEENERLRVQYEELRATMAAQQLSMKKVLQRSFTAPF